MDLMNQLDLKAEQHSRKFRHGGWRQPAAFTMASHGHHGTSANSWTYQPVFFQNPQQYSSLYKTSTSNLEALGCSEHPGAPQGVPYKLHMGIPSQIFQDLIISAWRSKDFFFFFLHEPLKSGKPYLNSLCFQGYELDLASWRHQAQMPAGFLSGEEEGVNQKHRTCSLGVVLKLCSLSLHLLHILELSFNLLTWLAL